MSAPAQPAPTPQTRTRALVVGAAGGVARATLALLAKHPRAQALISDDTELLLLDAIPADRRPPTELPHARWLPPQTLRSGPELAALLEAHAIDEVIELAHVGTYDCLEACAAQGASYLSTTYDLWPVSKQSPAEIEAARTMVRARDLFAPPDIDAGVHLMGMGMNPGLINGLVAAALRELAERSGRAPSLDALELDAVFLTELDTTDLGPRAAAGHDPSQVFACTWSPRAALEELLERCATFTAQGELAELDHPPHTVRYGARCGADFIAGHVVPHEELVTLGAMYPSVELAYLYQLCPAAEASLAAAPSRAQGDWETRALYPPQSKELVGANRLGVLLCSRSLGELWIGWDTAVSTAAEFGTNSVLLQVAAGVLSGWTLMRDDCDPGIWLPEDLDSARLIELACAFLGPLEVTWDREAPPRSLAQRRLNP